MEEGGLKVADYFVVAGMPQHNPTLLDEYSVEANLKTTAYQDPITDIAVIFPSLGENVPDYYQLIDSTPGGHSANLNLGSFRAPDVFLCFRRGRHRPPLMDIGVLYQGKGKVLPDSQVVEFTVNGHVANISYTQNSATFFTYRRATDLSPCNEFVVMDICIIVASKGEIPPHSFMKVDKNLNRGMVGSDVYVCYKKSMNRADHISYKPCLLSRFPLVDDSTTAFKLDDTVALFCLPMGATMEVWPTNAVRSSSVYSTFVLTLANREKIYGSSITFYEEITDEQTLSPTQLTALQLKKYRSKAERKIFANKCICLLSKWPFFETFQKFLFFLYQKQMIGPYDIPLERYISLFLNRVPFPSVSRPRVLIELSPFDQITLFQPEDIPLPSSGASFRLLLTNLGPDNCLLVLLLTLTEQKLLLHSLRPHVLTAVSEAIMQIIFPFCWQCPYIPLCPIGMSDYLAAPLPFVIGLDSRFFDLYDQPNDVNAIDLNTSTITLCNGNSGDGALSTKTLPKKAAKKLHASLVGLVHKCRQHEIMVHEMAARNDGSIDFEFRLKSKEIQLDLDIREAFLHFMVEILAGYRHYLLPITKAPTVGATDLTNLFDLDNFMRSRDRNYHRFYSMLMKTQLFTKFIEERSFALSDTNDASLAFFDECSDSVELSMANGGTYERFLELEVGKGCDDRTVFILPPDISDLPSGVEYKYEKFENLNENLYHFNLNGNNMAGGGENITSADEVQSLVPDVQHTPVSLVAKRTQKEIRSAQKCAQRVVAHKSPYLWTKILINTMYSLWFIHLPSFMLMNSVRPHMLRIGLSLLQRMHRLHLFPIDEICYRVMMKLCGLYNQPILAVKVLFAMKHVGLHPNAITYGYYNRAVLESKWPTSDISATTGQLLWTKLRNVFHAVHGFKKAGLRHSDHNGSVANSVNMGNVATKSSEDISKDGLNGYSSMTEHHNRMNKIISEINEGESILKYDDASGDEDDMVEKHKVFDDEALGVRAILPLELEEKPHIHMGSAIKCQVNSSEKVSRTLFYDSDKPSADTSRSPNQLLTSVPVTECDPLGALSMSKPLEISNSTTFKPLPNTPLKLSSSNLLGRPFESDDEPDNKTSTSQDDNIPRKNGSASFSLRQGLSSALSGFSPSDSITSRKTRETINQGFSNIKSVCSSAAFSLSKKVSVLSWDRRNSINSSRSLNNEDKFEDGGGSQTSSCDSRLISETITDGGFTQYGAETWNALTGVIFEQIWGGVGNASSSNNNTTTALNVNTFIENFEVLYSKMSKRPLAPVAMTLDMTTCSPCLNCNCIVYDEEIISGWTAEDSNLNTKCPFCQRIFVPFLRVVITDFRTWPMSVAEAAFVKTLNSTEDSLSTLSTSRNSATSLPSTTNKGVALDERLLHPRFECKSASLPRDVANSHKPLSHTRSASEGGFVFSSASDFPPPLTLDPPVNVPYLSPLVLRKELECLLEREGENCLVNFTCVDSHPIIFWNLLWYFERIGVTSHLAGLCLEADSICKIGSTRHSSWSQANHKNVQVRCCWDNASLHESEIPLYIKWQQCYPGINGRKHSNASEVFNDLFLVDSMGPLIPIILNGVRQSDLLQPLKSLLEERGSSSFSTESDGRRFISLYRNILFLTLVSLGQDNIDVTALDREYRRAYEKLPSNYKALLRNCDLPTSWHALFCRKLLRQLRVEV